MKFDELDHKMRVFETASDHSVLPGIYMIARIDGRGFTALTKKKYPFETPFDSRFRDYMIDTTKHLFTCGFQILYGYTQSDEISLLFSKNETAFGRKTRKYHSILAGEASGKFSLLLGNVVSFDCRISEITSDDACVDYFRWRNEDAFRNALNAHCYWVQVKQGIAPKAATEFLMRKSTAEKNEFLFQNGINFNTLPPWQKRGVGLYWKSVEKEGRNPLNDELNKSQRRIIETEMELPIKDSYSDFIRTILKQDFI